MEKKSKFLRYLMKIELEEEEVEACLEEVGEEKGGDNPTTKLLLSVFGVIG